jgi:hypothetical protein
MTRVPTDPDRQNYHPSSTSNLCQNAADEYTFIGDITDYWTYTQVRDRLLHMSELTDPAMRMYLIVRSMIAESKKNMPGQGLRRMTIDQLCFLLSREAGKPVSVSALYQILTLLKDLDLMVPYDTKQDVGASQLKGKEKAAKGILRSFVVRDLPPVPYTGWRNSWDKLKHYRPDWRERPPLPPMHVTTSVVDDNGRPLSKVTQVPQEALFQDPGTGPKGEEQEQDPFQDPGTEFQDPGTGIQDPGTDTPSTSEDAGSQTTLSKNSLEENDAASPRSGVDVRRTSSTGSSVRAREGGSAASSKDIAHPASKTPTAKHPREQLDLVRQVRAFYPEQLATGLPELPVISQAILDALDGDVPGADRTVQQLGARIRYRWVHHGWLSKHWDPAKSIDNQVGVAVSLVRPLKAGDRYGCANPRCENGVDVDDGAPCNVCPERVAARKAERRQQGSGPASSNAKAGTVRQDARPYEVPAPRGGAVWWDCARCDASGKGDPPERGICKSCREQAAWGDDASIAHAPEPYAATAPF